MCVFIKGDSFLQCEEVSRCRYERYNDSRSGNNSYCGKTVSIKYSECVSVTLVFQHAMRMCRIIFSSVACPPLHYFSTFLKKRQDFKEKVFCFAFLLSKAVLILRTIQRDAITNVHKTSGEVHFILVRF